MKRIFMYRASHIILDYLQALTPKYAHNTRKTLYFLFEKFYISLIRFFSNDSLLKLFWVSPLNLNLEL